MPNSSPTPDIEFPPFPRLRWADGRWEGTAVLTAWAGFQSRGGAYGSRDSAEPSDGRAALNVETPNDKCEPPSAAQRKAYETLLSQQDHLRDAMLAALVDMYASLRSDWADAMDPREFETLMPVVSSTDAFRNMIGLSNVHVLTIAKDGLAYIGFEFGCTWDVEHGLGIMTHGGRVVEVDDAVSSFQNWGAERDIESGGGTAAV